MRPGNYSKENLFVDDTPLFLIGFGGHAKSLGFRLKLKGLNPTYIIEEGFAIDPNGDPQTNNLILEKDFLEFVAPNAKVLNGIGLVQNSNDTRIRNADKFKKYGYEILGFISENCTILDRQNLESSIQVLDNAFISNGVSLGANSIVSAGAIIEHDTNLDDGVFIGPGATLCGGVRVGKGAVIGAGAVVLPGAFVHQDQVIPAGTTFKG